MITRKEVSQAQTNLEKLGFSPMAILKGAGKALVKGGKGVGKAFGEAGSLTLAARKSPGAGLLDTTLTGAGLLGAGAMAASPLTGGLSEKALSAVPVAGTAAKWLNPYAGLRPGEKLGPRYSHLDQMAKRRGAKGKGYNSDKRLSNYLVNSKNFQKTGATVYSEEDIKRYNKIKSKLEKTASVSGLRRAVQGAKSRNGDFARQALAYMAGATALGVGAPIVANTIGEGMNFARRGRLNRDYNA